jgi:hypothetical protein
MDAKFHGPASSSLRQTYARKFGVQHQHQQARRPARKSSADPVMPPYMENKVNALYGPFF